MYRLVASDMDETFLDADHAIPASNLRALKRMRELGVLFVPSSGRWYSSIMDNFSGEARELIEGGYVLSYNGGFINRVGDPTPLTTCGLSNECANAIYAKGLELGLCMHVNVADGHVFVNDAPTRERDYLESITGVTHFRGSDHPDLSFLEGRGIVKILYVDWDFDALQELGRKLAPMAERLGVDITFSSKRYLELMPAGVDKGTGLTRLADMLGIPMSEVIAVGDSANDLSMIKAAGLGVGVANVTDDVRPYCDVVLETAGTDGAFSELVERFLEPQHPNERQRLWEMRSSMANRDTDGFFNRVYDMVRQVPCGMVATYGQIARLVGEPRRARYVGYALHVNPEPGIIPCHRIVFADGRLAEGFAFGGPEAQRALLEDEGVAFLANGHVDLQASRWPAGLE